MTFEIAYKGQQRCLRGFAVELFGAEKTAMMLDGEIEKELMDKGYVSLCKDGERSLLIREDDLDELVSNGKAAWLER